MSPFEVRIKLEQGRPPFDHISFTVETRSFDRIMRVERQFQIDYFKSHFDLAMEELIRLIKKEINK